MAKKPDFLQQFRAARSATVPLIAVRTYDAASATNRMIGCFNPAILEQPRTDEHGKMLPPVAVLLWDCASGLTGYNASGRSVAKPDAQHPVAALNACKNLPEDSLVFFSNPQRFWTDAMLRQTIWNMRDRFKANGTTLVMLVGPGTSLPEGLNDDVLVIDEPLPTETELRDLVVKMFALRGLKKPNAATLDKAVDALIGLAMFPAEQNTAMCLTDDGLDLVLMWERKRQLINGRGMEALRGDERFVDLGGGDNLKDYLLRYVERKKPRAILFLDEVQRMFAGHGTENTGIKSGFVRKFLTWMQDNERDGILLIGPPGVMKSAIAKAVGNEANCPTIAMDLGGMLQKEVGSSEENLDRNLGVVDAIASDRLLVIATTNTSDDIPPELRRRFTLGTFFCDLPSDVAQEKIWAIYEPKYKVSGDRPEYTGWTGAEIKECCRKSAEMGYTLIESSRYIVPVCRAAADTVRKLREEANGKYIDAELPGIYENTSDQVGTRGGGDRKVRRVLDSVKP